MSAFPDFLGGLFGGEERKIQFEPIRFHNTLSANPEDFESKQPGVVRMYNCGPTVYGPQHIGNLSMFVFTDIVRRTLEANDYSVNQVINFTDVGHLTSDADDGDDKMMKGLRSEGLEPTMENMSRLAQKYIDRFLADSKMLNIEIEHTRFPRASAHIPAQIAMIEELETKGFAYPAAGGMYFDTAKFPEYGKLGNINLAGLKEGARVTAATDKRNPTDFLLWKSDDKMGWKSPWGMGFPGWHIECSAMIRELLGDQIDIHTGGIEHIPVHHNNEIAQSESTTGTKPLARFWLHRAHLQVDGGKMAKSEGNVFLLSDIIGRGFHPLSFRYLLLGAHYRQSSNFTWEALGAAQTAYLKLVKFVKEAPEGGSVLESNFARFMARMNDDLDTPGALAVMWDTIGSDASAANIGATLIAMDAVLGLRMEHPDETALDLVRKELGTKVLMTEVPQRVKDLLQDREFARAERRWSDADGFRSQIEHEGYIIQDSADGPRLMRKG